jgi:signal transduction histidine kinase
MERSTIEADPSARALIEAMPGPVMLLDGRRQVVLVNQRLRGVLDLGNVDLSAGRLPGDVFACRHAATAPGACGSTEACDLCGANRAIRECLATRARITQECRIQSLRPEDGGALDFRAHVTCVRIQGVQFLLVALEDISNEKRRQVLERTFFHDLMNTCGGIQGLADLLADSTIDSASESELKEDLCRLSACVVEQIVSQRQLLAAERGELSVHLEHIELEPFLHEVHALYRHHDVATGRSLRLRMGATGTLRTDRALLGRVVGNLVKNALEATPIRGLVLIEGSQRADSTSITVHNSTVIPREVQLQIFQRSFSTKAGEGRGIGTYGARLFAEQYLHGRLRFESGEATGTSFELTIPNDFPAN